MALPATQRMFSFICPSNYLRAFLLQEDMLDVPLWLVYSGNQILLFQWSWLFHTTGNIITGFFWVDMNKAAGPSTCSLAMKSILITVNSSIVPCLAPKLWFYQIVDQIIMWQSCTREIFTFCFMFFCKNPISYLSLVTVFCTSSFHVAQVVICSLWFAAAETNALFLFLFFLFFLSHNFGPSCHSDEANIMT